MHKLKTFLARYGEGWEFYMTEDLAPNKQGYKYTGFSFEGFRVYSRKSA